MKLALCNEVVGELDFPAQCRIAREAGYKGLELAPFTVDESTHSMSSRRRQEIRRIAEDAGTPIAGLHWLLVRPPGLSITTADEPIRAQTLDIMRRLIELCADLGGDYLVHGSPAQRRLPEDPEEATQARRRGIDAWAEIASDAEVAGVTYCIEPLAEPQANFVNTVAEAVDIVDEIGSESVRSMVDCSAIGRMGIESVPEIISRYLPTGHIAHVQVNDTNRLGPGQGNDDFKPVLNSLAENGYRGWIAVEPFVYEPDGPTAARECARYLQQLYEFENPVDT